MSKYITAYKYDETTFEYKYEFLVQESPLEKGQYLMPDSTTLIQPPETSENEIACFFNNQWVITPDFRNKLQINLETFEVTTVDYIGIIKKGYQLITENIINELNTYPIKYKVIDGVLTDISNTPEYNKEKQILLIEEQINNKKNELKELDDKRIRAICEPSTKDESTGETWLDYYNSQVYTIRENINNLNTELENLKRKDE